MKNWEMMLFFSRLESFMANEPRAIVATACIDNIGEHASRCVMSQLNAKVPPIDGVSFERKIYGRFETSSDGTDLSSIEYRFEYKGEAITAFFHTIDGLLFTIHNMDTGDYRFHIDVIMHIQQVREWLGQESQISNILIGIDFTDATVTEVRC